MNGGNMPKIERKPIASVIAVIALMISCLLIGGEIKGSFIIGKYEEKLLLINDQHRADRRADLELALHYVAGASSRIDRMLKEGITEHKLKLAKAEFDKSATEIKERANNVN